MEKKYNKNNGKINKENQAFIIYGRHAVTAALQNPKRKIAKILCVKENLAEIKKYTAVRPDVVDKKELDKLLGQEAVHQGMVLYCNRLENYAMDEIIKMAEEKTNCHVLVLDQVTDPQNIGAIIRSAVAFDTLALIVQDKNSPIESGAMDKAAAGMIEHLPIVRVTNLSRAIEELKKAGFWSYGLDSHAKVSLDSMKANGKIALIMGSEGKGMRRLVEESCDSSVKLPMSDLTESLNVSVAAAIALYEINKVK